MAKDKRKTRRITHHVSYETERRGGYAVVRVSQWEPKCKWKSDDYTLSLDLLLLLYFFETKVKSRKFFSHQVH
jgi:hypothetical protein